ncbi:uncharacterized protein LOC124261589 isoform X2 [Haliotis rubra]|uniref:uncharacterized protein LOC124261589 isoform X2 n=1 Tax=Haliotis rubra TaxID=36100 RepID=UPI001EE54F73|nr:uncharacterized protein LOC124261589 isoform X2 [Haliotis rubra]
MSDEDDPGTVTVFSGRGHEIPELWLNKFETCASLKTWCVSDSVLQFRQRLAGRAAVWYLSLGTSQTETFETLKQAFRCHFFRAEIDPYRLRLDLEARQQEPDESVESYLHHKMVFLYQSNKLDPESSEAIDLIYNGFHPGLQERLCRDNISTLQDLQICARKKYAELFKPCGRVVRRRNHRTNSFEGDNVVTGVTGGNIHTANTAGSVRGGMGNTNVIYMYVYQVMSEDVATLLCSCIGSIGTDEETDEPGNRNPTSTIDSEGKERLVDALLESLSDGSSNIVIRKGGTNEQGDRPHGGDLKDASINDSFNADADHVDEDLPFRFEDENSYPKFTAELNRCVKDIHSLLSSTKEDEEKNAPIDDTSDTDKKSDTRRRTDPVSVPDDQAPRCMQCYVKFTVFKRKHHCRKCGFVVCKTCLTTENSEKVCKACYTEPSTEYLRIV